MELNHLSILHPGLSFTRVFKLSIALVGATLTMVLFSTKGAIAKQQVDYPTKQSSLGVNSGGTIYHANGTAAWRGIRGNSVFYQNGQVAWRGNLGNDVYHDNGQLAWGGDRGDSCYYPNGSLLRQNCTNMRINLGSGIRLNVSLRRATLHFDGKTFVLAQKRN
jgi:hypothetical protein